MLNSDTVYHKEIVIGRLDNGRIEIELTINKEKRERETIEHKQISEYYTLSICGSEYYKNGRGICACGQIDGHIPKKKLIHLKPAGKNKAMVGFVNARKIWDIWDQWHLNDLSPGCIHQGNVNTNVQNWRELADIETKKCPNGYKYGSKWLLREIPQSVIDEIVSIFEKYPAVNEYGYKNELK